ncbi:zf-HC2 domain-containing protein, partial [Streptomyces collinus]
GNVIPARPAGTGAGAATPESQRRRSVGPLLQGSSLLGQTPVAPTSMSAPLLPGVPTPAAGQLQDTVRGLTTPVMAGAAAVSPLIRPLSEIAPFSLALPAPPRVSGPGLLSAPVPDTDPAPSSPPPSPETP